MLQPMSAYLFTCSVEKISQNVTRSPPLPWPSALSSRVADARAPAAHSDYLTTVHAPDQTLASASASPALAYVRYHTTTLTGHHLRAAELGASAQYAADQQLQSKWRPPAYNIAQRAVGIWHLPHDHPPNPASLRRSAAVAFPLTTPSSSIAVT
ncbi:hypothetical protein SODALDRAFT_356579 [Sodiomyces alkalinus F11]|uniref:Uncharacterized protein n=1 Tax=Sodiomyces alkalinus (strain CBS 110278 / VKM F-3762 / F11) TaxID=1314773 RepID=A0A3N2Q1D0_SODAK|nr:hypothetical protein SODALDRAFT_356579 [Sodiomyces alkalinus F11]ROT40569.1 hypothetical protein SODALDRAFT_356579 [Sodiomyces alkalinus F11]